MLPHVIAATRGLPGKPGAAPTSSTARATKGPAGFLHHFTPSRTPDQGTLDLRKEERAGRQTAHVGHPYPSPRREHTPGPPLGAADSLHRNKGPGTGARGSNPWVGLAALHTGVPKGPRGLAAAANGSAVLPPPPRPACWGGPGSWMTPTAL